MPTDSPARARPVGHIKPDGHVAIGDVNVEEQGDTAVGDSIFKALGHDRPFKECKKKKEGS